MGMPLRPGDGARIGAYDLVGRLGEGGMGTVYLGRGPDGRLVAIKTVRPDFADDAEFRGRFRSEVNRARQVPPFCTAEVLDADPDHDPPYLVVEFVDGPSLATVVKEDGPRSGAALHGLAVGIATALTAIHGAGVIHRDLKPANVLVAAGGIKVIDFGIARAFEATSKHTRTDQMVGTVAYMAPERFDPEPGRPTTAAADIFAWGAVVAYAATGRTPFGAESAPATAMRILTQEPDLTGLPDSLRDPVRRALAKEPGDRPTARDLLDVLVAAQREMPARPAPPAKRRTGRIVTATVAAAVLLGGAGLLASHRAGQGDADAPTAGGAGSAPAAGSATAPAASDSAAVPSPLDTHAAILRGDRQALLHIAEADRDLALDPASVQVAAADGTGAKSLFMMRPYGVDYLIRTLRAGTGGDEECLGVKIALGGDATLAPVECVPTKATLFALIPTGKKDDKARPTYWFSNDAYGFVQFSPTRRVVFVQEVGDNDPLSSFSLVDRGPA